MVRIGKWPGLAIVCILAYTCLCLTHRYFSPMLETERLVMLKELINGNSNADFVITRDVEDTIDAEEPKFTIADFKIQANTNESFLKEILNQYYYNPDTPAVLERYFKGRNSYDANELNQFKYTDVKSGYDSSKDVLVFLHIQKCGGTYFDIRFNKDLKPPCETDPKFPCKCSSGNVWVYMNGAHCQFACGLHPDWTELHRCIDSAVKDREGSGRRKKYFYTTQLRDPLKRYMSEFKHMWGGGQWQDVILGCRDGYVPWDSVRPCFIGDKWEDITFDKFIGCKYNLATNRITRMLADLTLTNCYNRFHEEKWIEKRAVEWVKSAKTNLLSMKYFGLVERMDESDLLLERAFSLKMETPGSPSVDGFAENYKLTKRQFLRVVQLVELDIHLYTFAEDLFSYRLSLITEY